MPARLERRIGLALDLYPCDILVVHRDAERDPLEARIKEVADALARAMDTPVPHVIAVPVRMTEAWLLIDEAAIRHAAGNPGGTIPLHLPPTRGLESLPNPKAVLVSLLRSASELSGRRLSKLRSLSLVSRVSVNIPDFSALTHLPAFSAMSQSVDRALELLESRC
ncbi:MAG TPA: hypothetical protein VFJ30_04855 [Phycisphaerae bacterium]|nr:hypothetical protein [Phycisphaerae bacterium]